MKQSAKVYLSLGSNIGDRADHLCAAVDTLKAFVALSRVSPVYETAPQLVSDQPDFLNLVIEGTTRLSPSEFLQSVKGVERTLGRQPGPRYGPRAIDIDILLFDDLTIDTAELIIPHPRMAERAFVLIPLRDLSPGMRHPTFGTTVAELAAGLPEQGVRLFGSLCDEKRERYNSPVL